jgi:hypothetical protein
MTQRRFLLGFALIASSAVGLGCHREHLSSNYGLAYAAWFSSQHAASGPANSEQAKKIIDSLDAQEAAVVSRSYRRGVGRGEDMNEGGRMLMVSPTRGGAEAAAYIPPPSVPMGQ